MLLLRSRLICSGVCVSVCERMLTCISTKLNSVYTYSLLLSRLYLTSVTRVFDGAVYDVIGALDSRPRTVPEPLCVQRVTSVQLGPDLRNKPIKELSYESIDSINYLPD